MSLRRLTENDLDAVASWYDGADELRARIGKTESDDAVGLLAITRHKGGRTIGVMEYRVGVPEDGWLGFRCVAVEPRLRGLGLDSEAVRLMEDDALKRRMARRFRVGVHQNDGQAFYFWLRLGYRPARPGDGSWPGERPHDMIVMALVHG